MKENKNYRILWIISFFVIVSFWLLLGSTLINIYSNLSYSLDKNNIFFNSEIYNYIGANIPFLSMWLGFYFCFKYINNIKISKLINSKTSIDVKLFIRLFIISIIFFIVVILIGALLNLYDLEFIENKWIERLILIPITLILTPLQVIAEEILFRAVILKIIIKDYDALTNKKKTLLLSIIISLLIGIIFIIPHLYNPEVDSNFISAISYYLLFGSLATFSILVTSGLEIAIAIHLANNFAITFFSTYENSALTSIPLFIERNEINGAKYFEVFCLLLLFVIIAIRERNKIKAYLSIKQ